MYDFLVLKLSKLSTQFHFLCGNRQKNEVPLVVLGIGKFYGDHEMGFLAYLSSCCPKFLNLLLSKVHIIKLWVEALSGEDKSC